MITVEYLPSKLNVKTDLGSCHAESSSEWKLFPEVFQLIEKIFDQPTIDSFASRLSHQLKQYVACKTDPNNIGSNAM